MIMLKILLIFVFWSSGKGQVNHFGAEPPQWLTSTYFRAGNEDVIATLTGNDVTPTYTFTFSSPLPGIPNLAYGIKDYEGDDYTGQEYFEIRREQLTASTFTVSIQIFGVTNIWTLNVPYIAIDPLFPHHLNSFDNVPINYNDPNGLVNITTRQMYQTSYTNVINYTQQASDRTYKTFKEPLSNNKVLLYICALFIKTYNQWDDWPTISYPIDFRVNYNILTTETYSLSITLLINSFITKIHFSQIVLDVADVQSSQIYYIVTEAIDFPNQGGFYPLPEEFVDNFIMGLKDFQGFRGQTVLVYHWKFDVVDGQHGVVLTPSTPKPHLLQFGLKRMGTMIFYMKTWQCPTGYDFFNLTSNMCQDMCGDYYYENSEDYQCKYCNYSCQDCSSPLDCVVCDEENDHRTLFNGVTCQCMENYFEDPDTTECRHCSTQLNYCAECFYNSSYSGEAGAIEFGCLECEEGYFMDGILCVPPVDCPGRFVVNFDINACEPCTLDYCLDCATNQLCNECDEANNYFLSQTGKCLECPVYGCDICASFDDCAVCKESFTRYTTSCFCKKGTFLDQPKEYCVPCDPTCLYCTGPTSFQCTACVYGQNRVLIGTTCVCDAYNFREGDGVICEQIDPKKCSRGFVKIEVTGECVELCGDGVRLQVECDDGNIVNLDGCSDQCKVEDFYSCSQEEMQTSICKLNTSIEITEAEIQKVPEQNKLEITLSISPQTDAYKNYDLQSIMKFVGADISIDKVTYEDGELKLSVSYKEDLEKKEVNLVIHEELLYQEGDPEDPEYESIYASDQIPFTFKLSSIPIKTDNNLDANLYSPEVYDQAAEAEKAVIGVTATALVLTGVTLFFRNSLPVLLIITDLQLLFLGLTAIDGMHPMTESLVHLKSIVGYNNEEFIPDNKVDVDNRRVASLGFDSSFANNFNVMLVVQCSFLLVAGLLYLISQKRNIMKTPFKIFQRQSLLLVFFNLNNFLYSISLLRSTSFLNLLFAGAASLTSVGILLHFLLNAHNYFAMNRLFNFETVRLKTFLVGWLLGRLAVIFVLTLAADDPVTSCIGAIACQASLAVFLSIMRPFAHLLNNALLIASQLVTLGSFISIYVFEGLEGSQGVGGILLISLGGALVLFGAVALGFNVYMDCRGSSSTPISTKIAPGQTGPVDASNENLHP